MTRVDQRTVSGSGCARCDADPTGAARSGPGTTAGGGNGGGEISTGYDNLPKPRVLAYAGTDGPCRGLGTGQTEMLMSRSDRAWNLLRAAGEQEEFRRVFSFR